MISSSLILPAAMLQSLFLDSFRHASLPAWHAHAAIQHNPSAFNSSASSLWLIPLFLFLLSTIALPKRGTHTALMLFFSCACIALARKSAFCSFVLHSIPCPASCVLHHIWSSPHPARVILHCVHRFPFMQLLCTTHVRIDTLIIAFHLPPSRVRAFVLVPLRLFPSSFIPAASSKPSLASFILLFHACFFRSASCFTSGQHFRILHWLPFMQPLCTPRTHTRIYIKICSLKQWLFSM